MPEPKEPKGCLFFFLSIFGNENKKPAAPAIPKVMPNKYFISGAESAFFHVLRQIVGNRAHILAQVSAKQLLFFTGSNTSNPGRSIWQNKINQKSIDFVLIHPQTLRPLVAIELNDSSHDRQDRKLRDAELTDLFRAADFPFLQIPCARSYNVTQIGSLVTPHISAA